MLSWIIRETSEALGKVVGEAAHQIGETYEAIKDIPDTFEKGYDKELFQSDTKKPAEPQDVSSDS